MGNVITPTANCVVRDCGALAGGTQHHVEAVVEPNTLPTSFVDLASLAQRGKRNRDIWQGRLSAQLGAASPEELCQKLDRGTALAPSQNKHLLGRSAAPNATVYITATPNQVATVNTCPSTTGLNMLRQIGAASVAERRRWPKSGLHGRNCYIGGSEPAVILSVQSRTAHTPLDRRSWKTATS
ncbi:hypothetical protein VTK56DRAFT_8444 [Thermocarpiscus australiensis]